MIFKFNPLHNFISPVTGRLPIDPNYILIGDRNGMSITSPILIDIRLDLIDLKRDFNYLIDSSFVLNYPSEMLPNAQDLFSLADGFMYNTAGIISTLQVIPITALPDLPYQNIWIGDINNRPAPNQRIGLVNLPPLLSPLLSDPLSIPPGATVNFGLNNIYTGGINLSLTEPIAPTTTLRVDMSNLPNLPRGKIWLGKVNAIPPIITIDAVPPFVHVQGDLNWDVRGALLNDYAVPQAVGLSHGKIFMGDIEGLIIERGLPQGNIFIGDSLGRLQNTGLPEGHIFIGNNFDQIEAVGLPYGNIFLGDVQGKIIYTGLAANQLFTGNPDNSGQIIKIVQLDIINLPNLTYNKVWVGDINNRPIESTLPQEALPDLNFTYLWTGDNTNRPIQVQQIVQDNLPDLLTGQIWIGDVSNRPVATGLAYKKLFLGNPSNQISAVDTIFTDNLPDLFYGSIWIGDINNRPQSAGLAYKHLLIGSINDDIEPIVALYIDNLPNLTSGKFWQGDLTNRPVEVDINYAPDDATYIIRTTNANLPNAHVTSLVGTGITKLVANGFFQIATPDTDYTTPTELNNRIQQLQTELDNLETQLNNLSTQLNNLSTRVTTAESQISTLQGQVSTLQGQIAALQAELATLTGTVTALGGTVAGLSTAVAGISATLYAPPLGLTIVVPALALTVAALTLDLSALQLTVDAPITGLVARMNSITGGALSSVLPWSFIVQAPHTETPNAQALSLLNSGILKNQTGTGILSIAVSDSDYTSWGTFQTLQTDFNTFTIQTLALFAALSLDILPVRGNVSMYDTLNNTRRGIYALADGINPHDAVNKGQLDAVAAGALGGTVTSITAGTGLNGGTITTSGTISLANTSVAAGSYNWGNFTVNQQGQLTLASSNTDLPISFINGYPNDGTKFLRGDGIWSDAVTSVNISTTSSGITVGGGPITNTGTLTVDINPTLQILSQMTNTGFLVQLGGGPAFIGRTFVGTSNQINITNADGQANNPVFSIASNPVIPGNAAMTIPTGVTSLRPITPIFGMLRANSTTNSYEIYTGSSWIALSTTTGTVTSVNISTSSSGVTVGGGPITDSGTLTIDINPQLQVLSQFNGLGIMVRQGSPSFVARTLTSTSGEINFTFPDGIGGNPSLSLAFTGVSAGTYSYPSSLTVDSKGRLSSVTSGSNTITLTDDTSGSGVLGSPIVTTLANSINRPNGLNFNYSSQAGAFFSRSLVNASVTYYDEIFGQNHSFPFSWFRFRYYPKILSPFLQIETFKFSHQQGASSTDIWSTDLFDGWMTIYQGLHMNNTPIDNVSTFAIGRTKGTVGASRIENYGTFASVDGPHYQAVTTEDNYPNLQNLCWSHDNISFNFDAYYDGLAFKSSHSGSNFQIYKLGNKLNCNYAFGVAQGGNINWLTGFTLTSLGKFGIGTSSPNGDLQFASINNNRKIVLWEGAINDHQYQGFGTNPSVLRVQLPDVNNDLVVYAGISPFASQECVRIKGNKDFIVQGNIYGKSPYGSMYFESNATTTTPASGIWTKLLGTTTSGLLNQFTMPTSNRLQYVGNYPITARVYADLSTIIGTSIVRTMGISIYKNGVRVIPSISYRYTDSLSLQYAVSTEALVELATNDYIELFIYVNTSSTFTPSQMKVNINVI